MNGLREYLAAPAGPLEGFALLVVVVLVVVAIFGTRPKRKPARPRRTGIGVQLRKGPMPTLKLFDLSADVRDIFVYEFEPYTHYRAKLANVCDIVTVGGTVYGLFVQGLPPTTLYNPPPIHAGEYHRPTSASIYADWRGAHSWS